MRLKSLSIFTILMLTLTVPAFAAGEQAECNAADAGDSPISSLVPTIDELVRSLEGQGLIRTNGEAGSGVPTCPSINQCSWYLTICNGRAFACSAGSSGAPVDLGYDSCQIGSYVFSCPSGQTVHRTTAPCGPCGSCTSQTEVTLSCQSR